MARQQGAVRFTGRLANTVGYKARDARGDGFDAMRTHVTDVANPQTLAQMSQRMKLTPIQNFYRGLQELLNHSWQGVRYKNPSRLHFYSMAMRALSTYGCPYVNKGDRQFVPWSFPISIGSIAVDTTVSNILSGQFDTALKCSSSDFNGTWGELSQALIDANPGLKNGDQVTLVSVSQEGDTFVPYYCRLVLDINSDVDQSDVQGENAIILSNNNNNVSVVMIRSGAGSNFVAGGVIISRLQNNVWQRSDSFLAIAASVRTTYNSSTAYSNMLASYKKSSNNDSDWYLNDGTASEQPVAAASVKTGSITINGTSYSFAFMNDGSNKSVPYEEVSSGGSVSDMLFTRVDGNTIQRSSSAGIVEILEYSSNFVSAGFTLMTIAQFQTAYPSVTVQAPEPDRP